jgi:hypothetical protein
VPIVLLLAFILLAIVASIVLMPLTLVQRYRVGTSRRQARGWLTAINAVGFALSAAMLLAGAAITNIWLPQAFVHALGGVAFGCVLGLVGLQLTRWETTSAELHYTPNRALVLGIMLVITARLLYGLWRSWHAFDTASDHEAWLVQSGAAGSLAAGGVVIAYYLTFWMGVGRRLRRHRRARGG